MNLMFISLANAYPYNHPTIWGTPLGNRGFGWGRQSGYKQAQIEENGLYIALNHIKMDKYGYLYILVLAPVRSVG